MKASEIRRRFLEFFERHGHTVVPSSSLVPEDDPTLTFTNAGMVQFKGVFLGQDSRPYKRAVTSQKCVRAGGKHNDLEEVGRTARHHTFFEMLGNFSFGDYFKRDAIRYAWEFLTEELGLDPDRLYATVHHTDEEAAALWEDITGIPPERIYRLGDKDNFWQMADTGPCGPCSELHYDVRPPEERGDGTLSVEVFEALGDRDRILELWNLVFMQFDRDTEGQLNPLPAPSIDTGAGLERIAAVLQGVGSNYHTDLFRPLLDRVAETVGRPYEPDTDTGVSYRVLTDHARAVAFLLADGVFPSNEDRGYVLRRILRRAARHAWLLGRREPTLVHVVEAVIDSMGGFFLELEDRREHLLATTRAEEERFLATIEGGLERFESVAPRLDDAERERIASRLSSPRVIEGADVFRLYDTFGFPADLTSLMAQERGYRIDMEGFQRALDEQRERSRADRAERAPTAGVLDVWEWRTLEEGDQQFVGYESTESVGPVLELGLEREGGERVAMVLARNPFYLEGGGQVSDRGRVGGSGFTVEVDEVLDRDGRVAVAGRIHGTVPGESPLSVRAEVFGRLRHDTERNHTATHLLHKALRDHLGSHVVQKGSLVAPDRLRFDFAHNAPLTADEIAEVEADVNDRVWDDLPVEWSVVPLNEARERGAMALFGEKYGDRVRTVEVPGVSIELCGGTHVRRTGEIGLFRITGESGVAAGVRRIEAVTGPGAFKHMVASEKLLAEVASRLKTSPEHTPRKVDQLLAENAELDGLLKEMRQEGGGSGEDVVAERAMDLGAGAGSVVRVVRLKARDAGDVRSFGDAFRTARSGVVVVGADYADGKRGLFTFVSDDLIGAGVRADQLVREIAGRAGGSGGGRPHMAQGGVPDGPALDRALQGAIDVVLELAGEPS